MRRRGKQRGVYAFIDSQNLNLGTQKMGWKMDWKKFRKFLADKYGVTRAFMFIGYVPEFEEMYEQLHQSGYAVVLKPTVDMNKPRSEDREQGSENGTDTKEKPEEKKPVKGNIDADLVLWAMKEMPNYAKAIIISGDGDFYTLAEYLVSQGKLLNLMTPNWQYSSLLKPYESYIIRIDQYRRELAYRDYRKPRPRQ